MNMEAPTIIDKKLEKSSFGIKVVRSDLETQKAAKDLEKSGKKVLGMVVGFGGSEKNPKSLTKEQIIKWHKKLGGKDKTTTQEFKNAVRELAQNNSSIEDINNQNSDLNEFLDEIIGTPSVNQLDIQSPFQLLFKSGKVGKVNKKVFYFFAIFVIMLVVFYLVIK